MSVNSLQAAFGPDAIAGRYLADDQLTCGLFVLDEHSAEFKKRLEAIQAKRKELPLCGTSVHQTFAKIRGKDA